MSSPLSFSIKGQGLKLDSAADMQPHLDALAVLGPDVEEIHLGGNTLGIEACEALAKVLPTLKKLKVADFADIFTGRLISEIPQALTALCTSLADTTSLETLDLSDNAFGGRCSEPIVPFLERNLSFQHFILNNNGLGPTGGNIIAAALLASAKAARTAAGGSESSVSNLRTFVCGRNRLENGSSDAIASALAAHGGLEVVRLPQNGIRMEGVRALCKGLSKNANLRTVDLQDNTLTASGTRDLVAALPAWSKLEELNLSDCLLSRRGGVALANALKEGNNPELKTLKVQYGEFDKRTVEALAQAVEQGALTKMSKVELNGNIVDAEDEVIERLKAALEAKGHDDAIDELDDMEEDEGEEEEEESEEEQESEEEEEAKEEKVEETKETTPSTSQPLFTPSVSAPAPEPTEKKPLLDFSVDELAKALGGMKVEPAVAVEAKKEESS